MAHPQQNITKRKPGPIQEFEVYAYQKRYGLKYDGTFGHQCMGQVKLLEQDVYRLSEENRLMFDALKRRGISEGLWVWMTALATLVAAWSTGVFQWLGELLT